MGRVRIVTDSSAQFLDATVIDRYQIEVVPLTVSLPTRSFREGIDLDFEAFLRSVASQRAPARLEAPSSEAFANLYTRLNHEADHIISIHLSSGLGAVWENARQGARTLLGRCEIEVIDSLTTSAGLAMLVEEAGRAAAAGASFEEIVHRVRGMVSRMYSVFYVGSFEYLRHNNLISEAQAMLGSMLDIKPVLTIEEGALFRSKRCAPTCRPLTAWSSSSSSSAISTSWLFCSTRHIPPSRPAFCASGLRSSSPSASFRSRSTAPA